MNSNVYVLKKYRLIFGSLFFIHPFITGIYVAPLQRGGYSEVLLTPARPNKTTLS